MEKVTYINRAKTFKPHKYDDYSLIEFYFEILHLCSAYYFHNILNEQKKENPDPGVITKNKWDHDNIIFLIKNATDNINRDVVCERIEMYLPIAQKFTSNER